MQCPRCKNWIPDFSVSHRDCGLTPTNVTEAERKQAWPKKSERKSR